MNIMEVQAGAETDCTVGRLLGFDVAIINGVCRKRYQDDTDFYSDSFSWCPSREITDAFDAIEQMHVRTLEKETGRLRGGFALYRLDEKYGVGWTATFRSHLDSDGDESAYAETAPLAICRAILFDFQRKS